MKSSVRPRRSRTNNSGLVGHGKETSIVGQGRKMTLYGSTALTVQEDDVVVVRLVLM